MRLEVIKPMKRYLNKALLYKEYRNTKWFVLGVTLIMLVRKFMSLTDIAKMISQNSVNSLELGNVFRDSLFLRDEIVFNLIFAALGALLIFGLDNKNYARILSMPFKKRDIAVNKIFIACLSVTIPYTIMYLILLVLKSSNYLNMSLYISYGDMTSWFFLQCLTAIFNILFIGLILTLCGNNIFAMVVSIIFVYYPSFFFDALRSICRLICRISLAARALGNSVYSNVESGLEFKYDNIFYGLQDVFCPSTYGENLRGYSNFIFSISALIILSIVLITLIILSFKKISYEERKKLIPFKGLERFFSFGVALSSSMLAILLFVNPGIIIINYFNCIYIAIKALVIFFGILIAGYIINMKLLKIFCK